MRCSFHIEDYDDDVDIGNVIPCVCVTHCSEREPSLTLTSTPDGIMGLLGSPRDEADIPW